MGWWLDVASRFDVSKAIVLCYSYICKCFGDITGEVGIEFY